MGTSADRRVTAWGTLRTLQLRALWMPHPLPNAKRVTDTSSSLAMYSCSAFGTDGPCSVQTVSSSGSSCSASGKAFAPSIVRADPVVAMSDVSAYDLLK